MLEKKDLENIKMGNDGSVTILEGINPRVQMLYCLYFNAVITKKDEVFYYIQEASCKDGWRVTEIPYKHITLGFLEELEEKSIESFFKTEGRSAQNHIETLLRGNAKQEIVYFDK